MLIPCKKKLRPQYFQEKNLRKKSQNSKLRTFKGQNKKKDFHFKKKKQP